MIFLQAAGWHIKTYGIMLMPLTIPYPANINLLAKNNHPFTSLLCYCVFILAGIICKIKKGLLIVFPTS